jgi:hypothetical protein
MADHKEMIHATAAAAAATGTLSHGRHGIDWWSTAVSCSPPAAGFSGVWSGPADGNSSRSGNAASSESPGSNSFAIGVSSETFQESAAAVAVQQPVAGTFAAADWRQPYYL